MQIGDLKVRLESKVHGSYESIQDVEGLISEAKNKQADFILIEANTNNGAGQHWRFDTHYRFFVKR
jgi:hypothetical protein